MLKLIKGFLLTAALCVTANVAMAAKIDTQNPYTMIQQVADQTFSRFNADQAKIKANPNHLKTIVEQELLPYVDYRYASLKVLGNRNIKTLQNKFKPKTKTDEAVKKAKAKVLKKVNRFTKAFKGYMVSTYASVFTEYTNQKIEFSPAKKLTKSKFVTVPVTVIEDGRPPIKLAFKLRRQKDKSWKVYDLIAEGVSLIQSKQSEIGGLVQREGIDHVIKMLNSKAKADVQTKTDAAKKSEK